ncbi:serine/threonine-protein kinase [Zavarzinia compransoris]|nr:serine/threonine-protein kinase [Zavarzinia compransoris]TDP48796.1 serine/threonine protein kinase [Zavarzinia compransoris]
MDQENTLPPESLLGNTYRIEALIARGGMGEVYRARNETLGTLHAIKIIRAELAGSSTIVELFRREAMALRQLRSDAIVAYDGIFRDERGRTYLVMEYVDGPSLARLIGVRPLPVEDVRRMAINVAAGLEIAHDKGVLHRDLSPDNIIFEGGDMMHPKIIDFGIARVDGAGEGTLLGGQVAGKISFIAPEQLGLYDGKVDARSDIYSLGLVMAAALLGRKLDMGRNIETALAARRQVPDLSALPEALRPVIAAMLQPDPAKRPASMSDVILRLYTPGSLRSSLPPAPAIDVPAPAAPRRPKGLDRKRLLIWAGGALLLAAATFGALLALRPPTPGAEAPAAVPAAAAPAPAAAPAAPSPAAPTPEAPGGFLGDRAKTR